jgi:hypothetical protein
MCEKNVQKVGCIFKLTKIDNVEKRYVDFPEFSGYNNQEYLSKKTEGNTHNEKSVRTLHRKHACQVRRGNARF